MRLEDVERAGREVDVPLVRLIDAAERVQRQRPDVPAPLGKRRQADRHDVEAVEQVTPERAALGFGGEVAVGRGDEARVDRDFARAAEAHDRAVLECAQQLRLHRERQFADLVEEDRAAARLLEPAGPRRARARERPALVAEQLRLEQRVRDRRAVDLDEGRVAARAGEVHGAGEQLLAGSRLAQQQHGRARLRHAFELAERAQQRRRRADDPVACRRRFERTRQHRVLRFKRSSLLLDQRAQLQQLAGEGRDDAQHRDVVGDQAMAAPDAVNGEHADRPPVHLDRHGDERDRLLRQPGPIDGAGEEARLGVDVLHDDRLAGCEHGAGDAFAGGVATARHLRLRQAVGMADRRRPLAAGVGQHDPAAVQAEQLGEQVKHLAQHDLGGEALADEAHHLAHQQQFLVAPGRVVAGRAEAGMDGHR